MSGLWFTGNIRPQVTGAIHSRLQENEARLTQLETSGRGGQASTLAYAEMDHLIQGVDQLARQKEQGLTASQELLSQFTAELAHFTQEKPGDVATSLALYEELQEQVTKALAESNQAKEQLASLSGTVDQLTTEKSNWLSNNKPQTQKIT